MHEPTAAKRDRILDGAMDEFASRGFEGASLRRIARAAGVTQPLINHHFGSKRGLYQAVWDRVDRPVFDRVRAELHTSRERPAIEALRAAYSSLAEGVLEQPELLRFYLQGVAEKTAYFETRMRERMRPMQATVLRLIRAAQKAGDMPAGDPATLHYSLVGAITFPYAARGEFAANRGRRCDTPAFLRRHLELLIDRFLSAPAG